MVLDDGRSLCVSSRKLVHFNFFQALLLIGLSRVWGFYMWAFPKHFRGCWVVTKPQIHSSCCNKDKEKTARPVNCSFKPLPIKLEGIYFPAVLYDIESSLFMQKLPW